jgi:predicted component of type VI protein secretion system
MLNKVGIAAVTAYCPFTTPALPAVFGKRGTFDVTFARDGDYHILILNKVFGLHFCR